MSLTRKPETLLFLKGLKSCLESANAEKQDSLCFLFYSSEGTNYFVARDFIPLSEI